MAVVINRLDKRQLEEERKFVRDAVTKLVKDKQKLKTHLRQIGYKIEGKRVVANRTRK